jgi:hypothetical protein
VLKLDGGPSGQAGSGGGSGTTPTTGDNCGSQTSSTTKQPPDVLLVLDRSSSMEYSIAEDCYCATSPTTGGSLCADTTGCTTRWQAIQPAVNDTVTAAADVNWGLKFFPTPDAAQCSVSTTMEVPVKAGNGSAVQALVQSATLSLSTPTSAALKAATTYLKSLTDTNPKFILLATDGQPNCGVAGGGVGGRGGSGTPNLNTVDEVGAASAAAAAYAAGFPVYVIGIGPAKALGNLDQIAKSGGTTQYYPVTSKQQLADAFASISKIVASCTFTLTKTPPDQNSVAVYLDKNLVPKDAGNGWSFGANGASIEFHGTTCEKVTSGEANTVEVLYGCPSPPPVIK